MTNRPNAKARAAAKAKARAQANDNANRKSWYRMQAANGDATTAEVFIYDEIGLWGIRAKDFIAELKALGDVQAISMYINSPGGDVFDGLAIYNVMKRSTAKVTVYVDGIAASIASIIAMAGDEVVMPKNTFMFVHNPWSFAVGDAEDMRDVADSLEKMEGALLGVYRDKTGLEDDEIKALMDGDTMLTAVEAKEMGFADKIIEPVQMAAKFDVGRIGAKNLPKEVLEMAQRNSKNGATAKGGKAAGEGDEPDGDEPNKDDPNADPNAAEGDDPNPDDEDNADARAASVARILNAAGAGDRIADFLERGASVAEAKAEATRVKDIKQIVASARKVNPSLASNLANDHIKSGASADSVRKQLFDTLASRQSGEISSANAAEEKDKDSSAMWAKSLERTKARKF